MSCPAQQRLQRAMRASLLSVVALTITALVLGVGTASATSLCTTANCAEPYPAETPIEASLAEGTQLRLLASVNVECASSSIVGKTEAESGKPLPLEITELAFGECKRPGTESSCTVTTESLPTSPSLEATGEGNGTLGLTGGEVNFHCGFFINCYYHTPTLQVQAKGEKPATLSAEELELKPSKGFLCPETSKLDVTYTVSEPVPAYLVEGRTFLCSTSNCTEGAYPAETALAASLEKGTKAKLLTSSGTVKCESSAIAGKTEAEAGNPLPLEITELAFGECELEGKEACTVTTESLPTSPYFAVGGEGNGTLGLTGGEVNFKCGFFIRCTYALPPLLFEGGSPASFGVAEAELAALKGLVCPETSKLHVAYTLTEPAPAYLVRM